jgi:hypothetical protein
MDKIAMNGVRTDSVRNFIWNVSNVDSSRLYIFALSAGPNGSPLLLLVIITLLSWRPRCRRKLGEMAFSFIRRVAGSMKEATEGDLSVSS